MALTNFILTVAAVSAAVLLLRSDVKQSAAIFRRNMRHIRNWIEEESASTGKLVSLSSYFPLPFPSPAPFFRCRSLCFVTRIRRI
ncbi:hypothetical protein MA16_Dca018291 [Dendrobium catenatum]|uniref:Secreted protein n=1 Tax=Dendrobium catenatum TaxID=906689 RepID=A0A2I0W185_9ASPA|nr:hypothetical protein MA16_Dca018291 [Dendrobium catenatum]